MPVTRLNHAVLFVRDLERSIGFYRDVLGFQRVDMTPDTFSGAAFLRAAASTNDHDLGLFAIGEAAEPSEAGRATVGMYHLAWEVDTLAELERVQSALDGAGALAGASDHGTTKSLYGRDPDGLEFEIVWLVPADLLDERALAARKRIGPLDLRAEQERYGADTLGGVGVSRPALR
jgi:catechol 2,3-dioxygenase-like lactoylglutathione lyase family enzyme